MIYQLNPPQNDKIKKINKEVEEANNLDISRKLILKENKLKQLENIVKKQYNAWDEGFSEAREQLKELNKLIEGDLDLTDFPFGTEKSSQIDLRLPAEKFRSLRTNFRRVVFGTPNLVVAKLMPDADKEVKTLRNKIESAINWTIFEVSNLGDCLKDTDLPCFRDGTSFIFGEFVQEIERGIDEEIYTDIITFQKDYPDAETAGCSEETYQEILDKLLDPTNDGEIRVEYEIDFLSKSGPQYTLLPLINFIHYPFFVEKIRDLTIYGYLFKEQRNKFLEKRKRNYYYSEVVEDVATKFDNVTYEDEWDEERDRIEGIDTEYKDAYKFARLIVKADLDNDRRVEVYNVIYWPEKEKILRVERYNIRKNIPCIVPFKFIKRDNRLRGISLLNDGKDLFGEINAIHRHRSNKRRLTSAITLIAPDIMKESLGDDYEFTTGGVIWVPDDIFKTGNTPRQLQLHNLNDDSYKDEELTIRFLEGIMGPSMGMSGQESVSDPSAPGNKTAMLLQQANYRVSDYIEEWKRTIPDMMALHIALLYQNNGSKIAFINQFGERAEIETKYLVSENIKWSLKSSSLSISPEAEAAKIVQVAQSAMAFGGIPVKIQPKILVDLWNNYITALRIPGWEHYIINIPEQVQGVQQPTLQSTQAQQHQQTQIAPQITETINKPTEENNL